MSSWYRSMLPEQRKTFWACFLGWALDAMDVQLFAFVIPTLLPLWGMTKGEAGIISTSAIMTSALGGILGGMLADRIGRVRVLKLSIFWFTVFTGLSAFTNSFPQLLITRSLQGLGFGGEWAAGAILIGEVVDKSIRGRAVGTVQAGWPVGYAAAALAWWGVFSLVPEPVAWRVLFLVGLLPGLLVLWMRRGIKDSHAFRDAAEKQAHKRDNSVLSQLLAPGVRSRIVLSCLMVAGALGGNYTILTWLVTYLRQTREMTVNMTSLYLIVNLLGSFAGYVMMAHVSDRIGRRRTFSLSAVGAFVTVLVYTQLDLPTGVTLILGFPLGFFQSGIISGMGACFTELFPTRIRGTAAGISYNVGRGAGGMVPAIVGMTSASMGLALAIGIWAACSYVIVFIVAIFLPETHGVELEHV